MPAPEIIELSPLFPLVVEEIVPPAPTVIVIAELAETDKPVAVK
jgi:hypothetical protein